VLLELQTLAGGRAEGGRRASLSGRLLSELAAALEAAGTGGDGAAMALGRELAVGGTRPWPVDCTDWLSEGLEGLQRGS
jgi:hypothetical protein